MPSASPETNKLSRVDARGPSASTSQPMKTPRTLAIDIGGSGLKAMILDVEGTALTDRVRARPPLEAARSPLNDAGVQGFGVIEGRGVEMVIALGTGMGWPSTSTAATSRTSSSRTIPSATATPTSRTFPPAPSTMSASASGTSASRASSVRSTRCGTRAGSTSAAATPSTSSSSCRRT